MGKQFIKIGQRYLLKDSNSVYVSEAEMKKIKDDEKKDSGENADVENKPIKPDVKQKATTASK